MKSKKYLLGIDFGGGASKATLLSSEGVTFLSTSVEYPTYCLQNGWAEQSPEELYEAFLANVRFILKESKISPDDITALGLSAASQTGVYLDKNDEVVRSSIFWTDVRGAPYANFLKTKCGDRIYKICHNAPTPARTITHLMWIREHEPEKFQRIEKVMFVKDFIRYKLTGDFVTDYIDAMGSLLMDVPNNCWSEELCQYAGIKTTMLPAIKKPTDILGTISPHISKETGLSEKTIVIVGSTDTVMEVFANGAIHEGQMTVKLATAGRICPITTHNIPNPLLVNYKHVVPGMWYPGTGTKSCAASYRWYRDILCDGEKVYAESEKIDVYSVMDHAAERVTPGCDNLFFHPYLQGELTPYFDAKLRGSFVGICSYHTKAHFNRAVLEGVAFSLKDCYSVLKKENLKINQAIIIGGGAKSPLWRQIVSDMLGLELIKTTNADSSLGSAMLAGVSVGLFDSFEKSVESCVKHDARIVPNYKNNKVYDKQFKTYKKIHDALESVYAQLEN